MQKTFAESVHRPLDAVALDQIDTDAQDTHKPIEFATDTQHTRKRREEAPQKLRKTDISSSRFARSVFGVRDVFAPLSLLECTSSGILRHGGEHFFNGCLQPDPHRSRDNRVANVQFGETRDMMDECDVFVIDTVTGVDLHV